MVSAYKSRSSGEIFRYNWVESHARAIDFVHSEEQANGIAAQPDYKYVHCYGNVILNTSLAGRFAPTAIHLGGDNGGEDGYDGNGQHFDKLVSPGSLNTTPSQLIYREQMYFYNNTFISIGDGSAYSALYTFDLSLAGGNVGVNGYVHPRTRVDAWNNVFYNDKISSVTWVEACGNVNLHGNNYVSGTIGDSISSRPDWVSIVKNGTLVTGDAGFTSISAFNFKPTATSVLLDKSSTPTNLPSTFGNYPVQFQPRIRSNGMVARTASGALDLGTFEIEDSTVPAVTTLPSISGSSVIGSTLTASPGVWTNSPSYTFQWMRNGVTIANATSNTYTTSSEDNSTNISVQVTATANGKTSVAVSSSMFVGVSSAPAPSPAPSPSPSPSPSPAPSTPVTTTGVTVKVVGIPNVGEKVYASLGNPQNQQFSNISYKWKLDGVDIAGATDIAYSIKSSDDWEILS